MSLKIYKTQLTPAKNALLDNIEDYLELIENPGVGYIGEDEMTYSDDDFQYIKPDIDIKIKINVPLNNNSIFESIGNYLRIEQSQTDNTGEEPEEGDVSVWYYFILSSKWIAQGTLELVCSMDTVNTFHDFINNKDNWNEKTSIMREHEKEMEFTNISEDNKVIYRKIIDRYSEDFEPTVLLKVEDERIEEPNSTGVKEWYLVYKTVNNATDSSTAGESGETTGVPSQNKLNCYVYPSEEITYRRVSGQSAQAFSYNSNSFNDNLRYGITSGSVSFTNLEVSINYPGYRTSSSWNSSAGISVRNEGSDGSLEKLLTDESTITITGSITVGDEFTNEDGRVFKCRKIVWYKNTSRAGGNYTNLPMGIFYCTTTNAYCCAVKISKFNNITVVPKYFVIYRGVYWQNGYWSLSVVFRASKFAYLDSSDKNKLDWFSDYGEWFIALHDVKDTSDNSFTSKFDVNWGRTSIHIINNGAINFNSDVPLIYSVSWNKDIPGEGTLLNGNLWYTNGSGAASYKIEPFSSLDRTDPTLVKILAVPYCPTAISYISGTPGASDYEITFDTSILDVEAGSDTYHKKLKYRNVEAPQFGKPLNNILIDYSYTDKINDFYKTGILEEKSIENESKLENSTFKKHTLVYDNVSKVIRGEDIEIPEQMLNISNYYQPTNTINSKILFKFDIANGSYKEIYDWDKVLISNRDNEIPIFNNDYLNYLRYGYKTERENLEATAAAQKQQATTNAALGVGGGLVSGALIGAKIGSLAGGYGAIPGAIIGAVIGTGAALAASSANLNVVDTNIENAQRSMSQKLLELQHTASTVINGGSAPDLMTNYSGNRLHHMLYEMPVLLKEALYDKLFYCGYSHPVQAKPELDSRYNFNFIQCNPVFKNESTNRYNYYMADIKDRFNTGITKFHNINTLLSSQDNNQLYTDWEQKYENWYIDRKPKCNVYQELSWIDESNGRFEIDIRHNSINDDIQSTSETGFKYVAEVCWTEEQYLEDGWEFYMNEFTDYPLNTEVERHLRFINGRTLSLQTDDNNFPYAIRFQLMNATLGVNGEWKEYIIQYPENMILEAPTIESFSQNELVLNTNYQTGQNYMIQMAILYNNQWTKYPYYSDTDYNNDYTSATSFQLDTDYSHRGLDIWSSSRVYFRVIDIDSGEYSKWNYCDIHL